MNERAIKHALRIIEDKRFAALMKAADEGILTYTDLDSFDLPDGCGKDDVWRLLHAIRRPSGIVFPGRPYGSDAFWYAQTPALIRAVKKLEMKAKEGYLLDNSLHYFKDSPYIASVLDRKLSYAFRQEGIEMSEERLHEISKGSPADFVRAERVAANWYALYREIHQLSKQEITLSFVSTLHLRLMEGVDYDGWIRRGEAAVSEIYYQEYRERRVAPLTPEEYMGIICRVVRESDQFFLSPVLCIVYIFWLFSDFEVFSCYSALVGALLRDVLAIKWGYPVLSWVDIPYIPEKEPMRSRALAVFDSWRRKSEGLGSDLTDVFVIYVRECLDKVERLEAISASLSKINALIEGVFSGPVNNRQRAIFSVLSRNPQAEFSIDAHRKEFGVAYSTAHADFNDLEKQGYLQRTRGAKGKAIVYVAQPELRSRLMKLNEAAVKSLR